MNLENCKTLNDICRQEFGKANYTNREKVKRLLAQDGIDWKEWLQEKKKKEDKYCLNCGKLLNNEQKKFCSSSCAAKYNNIHKEVTIETRKKYQKLYRDEILNLMESSNQ